MNFVVGGLAVLALAAVVWAVDRTLKTGQR